MERLALAQAKRFMERYNADLAFRDSLAAGHDFPALMERYALQIDPAEILPLWCPDLRKQSVDLDLTNWPLAAAYVRMMNSLAAHRETMRRQGGTEQIAPRFHRWRQRQIARCASEMPVSAAIITHAVVALELSKGCSKGCWFCGVSAGKFGGNLKYDEAGKALWRGVLHALAEQFGPAMHTGFCYWATDPSDNPDYAHFLADYRDICGLVPETTTAAPLADLEMIRTLMRMSREHPSGLLRFSVTSLRALDDIHQTFDALELLDVQLIMQNREALGGMARAGRSRIAAPARAGRTREEHASIACVSGFLINMVDRQIELVTPVPASEQWPLGYRSLEKRHFQDAVSFRQHLRDLISIHMSETLDRSGPVAFRDDLSLDRLPDDPRTLLRLRGAWASHETTGPPFLAAMADLIAAGAETPASLEVKLRDAGAVPEAVSAVLSHLWQEGFLRT